MSAASHPEQESTRGLSKLAQTALLGVERAALPQLPEDSPLASFADQLHELAPEYQLLSLAGVASLYEDAGLQVPQSLCPADPADASSERVEEAQPASPLVGQLLVQLLEGARRALLPEFLASLAKSGLQIPREFVPNILDFGINQYQLRPILLAVVGRQGLQLAAENPKWVYADPSLNQWEKAVSVWRTLQGGTARQGLLRHLRTMNPTLGLRVLETAWKVEQPGQKLSLIRTLEIGLNINDELFLEVALDDRSHMVRKKAAELLSCLPDSRLSLRMQEATEGLLRWQPEEANPLGVNLPDEVSREMQRDGISRRGGKDEARNRRALLLDMVTSTPLNSWTEGWQVTAEQVVQALPQCRCPQSLLRGFVQAAERQRNLEWVHALLDHAEFRIPVTKLVPLLSPEAFDALLKRIDPGVDSDSPLSRHHSLILALRRWPGTWSECTSRRWLESLRTHMRIEPEQNAIDSLVRTTAKQFAVRCVPIMIDEALDSLAAARDSCPSGWGKTLDENRAVLRFRQKMIKAIAASGVDTSSYRQNSHVD